MVQFTAENPFNPLDLRALGDSLALAIREQAGVPIGAVGKFPGAGVYALYYHGPCSLYSDLVAINAIRIQDPLPIYVGRSKDTGARRGLDPFDPVNDTLLASRIREHRRNLACVAGLDVADFQVRWLITMPIWVPLAEGMLIRRYRPLWNGVVEGFGIHAPGKGRGLQERSTWDHLHPGRGFAATLPEQPNATIATVRDTIRSHLQLVIETIDR